MFREEFFYGGVQLDGVITAVQADVDPDVAVDAEGIEKLEDMLLGLHATLLGVSLDKRKNYLKEGKLADIERRLNAFTKLRGLTAYGRKESFEIEAAELGPETMEESSAEDAKMLEIETGLREAVMRKKAKRMQLEARAAAAGEHAPALEDDTAPLTDAENAVTKLEVKFKREREEEKVGKKVQKTARLHRSMSKGAADAAAKVLEEAKVHAKACDAEVYASNATLRAAIDAKAAAEAKAAEAEELLHVLYGKALTIRPRNAPTKETLNEKIRASEAETDEHAALITEHKAALKGKEKASKSAAKARKKAVGSMSVASAALANAQDVALKAETAASTLRRRLHATFRQLKRAVRAVAYSEINSKRSDLSKLLMMSQTTSAIDRVLGECVELLRVSEPPSALFTTTLTSLHVTPPLDSHTPTNRFRVGTARWRYAA